MSTSEKPGQARCWDKKFLLQEQDQEIACHDALYAGKYHHGGLQIKPPTQECSVEVELVEPNRVTIDTLVKSNRSLYGKFLLCRVLSPPLFRAGLHFVVDDPAGPHAVRVSLYEYVETEGVPNELPTSQIGDILPVGTVLAVKNPWLTSKRSILVCWSRDIELMDSATVEGLNPNIKWEPVPERYLNYKNKNREPVAVEAPAPESAYPADEWNKIGIERVVGQRYLEAIEAFTNGIQLELEKSPSSLIVDLLANRTAAYLGIEWHIEALDDAEQALQLHPTNMAAIYGKTKALSGSGRYEDAKVFLDALGGDLQKSKMVQDLREETQVMITLITQSKTSKIFVNSNELAQEEEKAGATDVDVDAATTGEPMNADEGPAPTSDDEGVMLACSENITRELWNAELHEDTPNPLPKIVTTNEKPKSTPSPTAAETGKAKRFSGNQSRRNRQRHENTAAAPPESYTRETLLQQCDFLTRRAATYLNAKWYSQALTDVDQALRMDPSHVKAIYRKTKALHGLARYDEALAFLSGLGEEVKKDKLIQETLKKVAAKVRKIARSQSKSSKKKATPTCSSSSAQQFSEAGNAEMDTDSDSIASMVIGTEEAVPMDLEHQEAPPEWPEAAIAGISDEKYAKFSWSVNKYFDNKGGVSVQVDRLVEWFEAGEERRGFTLTRPEVLAGLRRMEADGDEDIVQMDGIVVAGFLL